ncbi:bacteriohemerythrin [Propionivibrio soli]|jgi:hemerythrin|uniref:bacteriohemerythrin n=1 Tax=Propionivibrio soli TaxID=2976531 RepID=UPI0021E826E0|nr:bacteriohemerythrin [Propionivibrio soli]
MAGFKWTDDLSVGNTMIDNDHQHLFALVNKLYEAMSSGKGNAVLGEILDELITYTKSHFGREERLMQQLSYPEYSGHKAEHDKLVSEVSELERSFQAGAMTLSSKVYMFLNDWLNTHIKARDKLLGQAAKAVR